MKDTETIDRLFLELSQFTTATTAKELELQDELKKLKADLRNSYDRHASDSETWTEERLRLRKALEECEQVRLFLSRRAAATPESDGDK